MYLLNMIQKNGNLGESIFTTPLTNRSLRMCTCSIWFRKMETLVSQKIIYSYKYLPIIFCYSLSLSLSLSLSVWIASILGWVKVFQNFGNFFSLFFRLEQKQTNIQSIGHSIALSEAAFLPVLSSHAYSSSCPSKWCGGGSWCNG